MLDITFRNKHIRPIDLKIHFNKDKLRKPSGKPWAWTGSAIWLLNQMQYCVYSLVFGGKSSQLSWSGNKDHSFR